MQILIRGSLCGFRIKDVRVLFNSVLTLVCVIEKYLFTS